MSSYRHIPHPHIMHPEGGTAGQGGRPVFPDRPDYPADERAENTYQDAEAVLHEALQIQEHLLTQDRELERVIAQLGCPPPRP